MLDSSRMSHLFFWHFLNMTSRLHHRLLSLSLCSLNNFSIYRWFYPVLLLLCFSSIIVSQSVDLTFLLLVCFFPPCCTSLHPPFFSVDRQPIFWHYASAAAAVAFFSSVICCLFCSRNNTADEFNDVWRITDKLDHVRHVHVSSLHCITHRNLIINLFRVIPEIIKQVLTTTREWRERKSRNRTQTTFPSRSGPNPR